MELNRLSDLTRHRETTDLHHLALARVMAKHIGGPDAAREMFAQYRGGAALLTKYADLLSVDTFDGDPLSAAFLGQVDQRSILSKIEPAMRLPPYVPLRMQVLEIEATEVAEGEIKPVARLQFSLNQGQPSKYAAMLVFSNELARSTDAATLASLQAALASATAAAVDRALVTAWTAGSPIAATTSTLLTVGQLLEAVSDGAPARPYLIGSHTTLAPLAAALEGLRALGVAVISTPAAAGKLIAVDGAGLVLNDGSAELSIARHASVALSNGDSPETFTNVSLWQANLTAMLGERFLRVTTKPGAVAFANIS